MTKQTKKIQKKKQKRKHLTFIPCQKLATSKNLKLSIIKPPLDISLLNFNRYELTNDQDEFYYKLVCI
ncbi:hypothetical protein [Geminocystis sp. GBBB08]|uniref:hypothetical protein n=1 Tax=Geminocystis sp. GBBB08 TaxID=2604140 RepID=UPI0027E2A566|nr:hypothetical protein [Geminocystis sp. GBBB08]